MTTSHNVVGSGDHHVFCLHGWFGCSRGWGLFPEYLDTEKFTFHFLDNRGYGTRMEETGDYSLREVADDVIKTADDLGVQDFSLIGHSMGGSGVLRVLSKVPGRVRRIVAMTPVSAVPTPLDDDGRALFFGAPEDRDKRYGIVDFTTGNRLTPHFVNSVVEHSLENSTVEAFAGSVEAWVNADFMEKVRGRDLPILVIPGEHDPALGEATVNETWKPYFPHCEIRVMPNAGHYPMFEAPALLATWVNEFLAS